MYLAENFTKRFNLERNESKLMNQITKFKRLEKDQSKHSKEERRKGTTN